MGGVIESRIQAEMTLCHINNSIFEEAYSWRDFGVTYGHAIESSYADARIYLEGRSASLMCLGLRGYNLKVTPVVANSGGRQENGTNREKCLF